MTEPANAAGEAARLDELAEVTREYAAYSRRAYGVGAALVGTGVIVAITLDVASGGGWVRWSYLLLPPGWLLSIAAARKYYQRKGGVVQTDQQVRWRSRSLALTWLASATHAYAIAIGVQWSFAGVGARLTAATALFGSVAAPLLAAEVAKSKQDASFTLGMFVFSGTAAGIYLGEGPAHSGFRVVMLVLFAGLALVLVAGGLRDHSRYRILERRLAALKGGVR